MRCMILYLIAAFVLGIAFGVLISVILISAFGKKPKHSDSCGESVTKCFLEILRH